MLTKLLGSRELIDHPGRKGAASERNWHELIREYLPARYKLDSGFVVDLEGRISDEIDLLVLDNQYSPVLFSSGGVHYVPAESVYAAFEVKQELDAQNLEYAGNKVASVRELTRTTAPIPHAGGQFQPKPPARIIGGLLATESSWTPSFGEPFQRCCRELVGDRALEIGCVVRHGAFWSDSEPSVPVVSTSSDRSLVTFIFRLLGKLQSLGTVSAIDYSQWLSRSTR